MLRSTLRLLAKTLTAASRRPARAATRRATPAVERLEDRQLLSTFTVLNTNDSGAGSFRQAILNANGTPGTSTINFNIPWHVGGAQTINLLSPLPALFNPVVIDGTTQTGYLGQPLVELNGALAGSGTAGLDLLGGHSTVKGLVINRFGGAGIQLNSSYNTIANDYIGTDVSGTVARPNAVGVYVSLTSYNVIGGTTPAERDVISGNTGSGVYIYAFATNNTVADDFIGTDVTGSRALGNGTGVTIAYSSGNTIGNAFAVNVISGNAGDGVDIVGSWSSGNVLQSNFIGTDASGLHYLANANGVVVNGAHGNSIGVSWWHHGNTIAGNRGNGVVLTGSGAYGNSVQNNSITHNGRNGVDLTGSASNNVIGGASVGWPLANTIAANGGYGVYVESGSGDTIRGNSIYANVLGGIRLGPGANNNRAAPQATFMTNYNGVLTLQGPPGTYTIDFYLDPTGEGQGRTYYSSMTVTIGSTGSTSFQSFWWAQHPELVGVFMTATATDATGNTSAFSADWQLVGA